MKNFISFNVLKKIFIKKKNLIKIYSRSSTIFPFMENYIFGVHNGKIFVPVFINNKMYGYKFGSFSLTRKFIKHKTKDKKVSRNKKK